MVFSQGLRANAESLVMGYCQSGRWAALGNAFSIDLSEFPERSAGSLLFVAVCFWFGMQLLMWPQKKAGVQEDPFSAVCRQVKSGKREEA